MRISKRSAKMTRVKRSTKAAGLPDREALMAGRDALGQFIAKKAMKAATRNGRRGTRKMRRGRR